MQVQLRKLSAIKPYKGNPRLNKKPVEAVGRSIQEFGFRQRSPNRDISRFGASHPIVVDKAGVIVAGPRQLPLRTALFAPAEPSQCRPGGRSAVTRAGNFKMVVCASGGAV